MQATVAVGRAKPFTGMRIFGDILSRCKPKKLHRTTALLHKLRGMVCALVAKKSVVKTPKKRPAASDAVLKRPAASEAALKRPAASDAALKRPAASGASLKRPAASDVTLPAAGV